MHCAGNIICMNKYIVQSCEGQTAAAAAVIISKSLKSGWAPGEGERAISIRVYYYLRRGGTTEVEEFNWSFFFFCLCLTKEPSTLGWRSACWLPAAPDVIHMFTFPFLSFLFLHILFYFLFFPFFWIRIFSSVSAGKVIWITTERSSIGFPRDHHHLRACVRVSVRAEWHYRVSGSRAQQAKGKR